MALMDNWWLLGLITPLLMATACLIDSCLVGNQIYRSSLEGTVVGSLFCVIPGLFILLFLSGPNLWSELSYIALSSAAGAALAYVVHVFFYFQTLRQLNDVTGAETFITLSVLIVPLFAWLLLGEILPRRFYLMFLLAAVGAFVLCWPLLRGMGCSLLLNMLLSVVAVSLSMVLQADALERTGFVTASLIFNVTCVALALVTIVCHRGLRNRVVFISRRVPVMLITAETLALAAIMCSHRATELSPSVSLVALIECLLPLIIVLLSLAVLTLNKWLAILSVANHRMLLQQLARLPSKLFALTLLLFSVSLLSV